MTFEDFPFDQMYTVPEYCDWVVVYEMLPTDNSTAATMKQVRFQNWTEDKSVKIADVSAANLEYELSETGTLTINGFGNMPEFSSVEIGYIAASQVERDEPIFTQPATEDSPGVVRCFEPYE